MSNQEWSTACEDWERKIINQQSIIPPPIFPDQAEMALNIFKQLKVVDLPSEPTFGECSADWVFDFVRAIFGAYDADTGNQLIKEYGLLISKKNIKSTMAAGIMVTALILCWRKDEEHLILAPTKEVANNSFTPAASMIRADETLSDMFQIQDHIRTITHRLKKNTLKVVAADTDTVSGKKAGKVLVDELWLFGKKANAESMFMEALGGQASRSEGFTIYLTTQSDDPPAGAFKSRLDYWRKVRDGEIKDKKTLGILYEFPESMVKNKSYLKPENFYITNPNLGRSVHAEYIIDGISRFKQDQTGKYQQFLAKHLNIEIGLNLRSDRWRGADLWEKQAQNITVDDIIERSEVIEIGIDGGGLDDLLGFSVMGRDKETKKWLSWSKAFAYSIVFERRKIEAPRLLDFVNDGDLSVVSQIGEDTQEIANITRKIFESNKLDRIGIDPLQTGQIIEDLVNEGIPQENIVTIPQGSKLYNAITTAERKLAEGVIIHADQPLMDWCVSNARIEQKGNSYMISKQISGRSKIDPLMAFLNCVAIMLTNPESKITTPKIFFI